MTYWMTIFFIIFNSVAFSDIHTCYFPCQTSDKHTCSHYYTRIDKNSFYEDKKWSVFEARENEDHLLLIRIGFPTEEDLPEFVFVEHVYIDKFNDLKFKNHVFTNEGIDELTTGKCEFKIFENPLSTK